MKKFTSIAACLLMGTIPFTASAKDLYVSADGDDSNDGLTSATAKKTLTALDAIIFAWLTQLAGHHFHRC